MNNPVRESLITLVMQHLGNKEYEVCLAVWFNRKAAGYRMAYLLEVAKEFDNLEMVHEQVNSFGLGAVKTLHHWMVSPARLEEILSKSNPADAGLRKMFGDFEVLSILPEPLGKLALEKFGADFVLPDGAVKCWYLSQAEWVKYRSEGGHYILNSRPTAAVSILVDSADFGQRKGIMFSPDVFSGRWSPNTAAGMSDRTWHQDWRQGKPGVFVFAGGRSYRTVAFEVVSLPSFSSRIVHPNPDHMYVQVLLKAE